MKKYQFFFVLIIGVFLFFGFQENSPNAVNSEIDAATAEKMVRDFNSKLQQNPEQMMEQFTSDSFVFINGEGAFVTKAQMNETLKSWKIGKWDLNNLKVRVYGHVFVATGVNNHSLVNKQDGSTLDYQTAFTYIYQEKDGKLEEISLQQHSHVKPATNE
ncbi:nuclear transport factor 2 family protein [Algoriphagus sp.]|uniref:nuclear transport factor 2 family protein n=1 Tax=Algoriphagus sp. TaxID=1872435 RepID=UPI0025FB6B16|nr:nuclear transport factor 2 family protein [Algoriphagus sp.]